MDSRRLRGRMTWIALPVAVLALMATFISFQGTAAATVAPAFDATTMVQAKDTSFEVVWATDLDEATVLEYSQTLGDLISQGGGGGSVIADSRGGFTTGKTHSATIPGNDITVSFDIFSGGVADPNGPYTVSNVGLGTPAFSLITANGDLSLPGPADAPNCIILFQIQTAGGNSQWANASTASDGTWSISTGILYNEALSGFFPYSGAPSATDIFDIVAICEPTLQKNITPATNTLIEVTGSYFAIDFEVAPLPAFTVGSDSVTEAGSVDLTLTLNPTSTSATSVTWSTADGTASTAAGDYTAVGATVVNFTPGQANATITVATLDDSLDEGAETILIQLSSPTGGQSVIGGGGTVTINDDGDAPPTVAMASATASQTEGDSPATSTVTVQVDLSGTSGLPIVVTYVVNDGTATTGGNDYSGTSPITIAAGSTSGNIVVTLNGDDTFETDETFDIVITGATTTDQTVTTTAATTTVTIQNDDKPVTAVDVGGTDEDSVLNVAATGLLTNDPSFAVDATLTTVDFVSPAKGVLTPAADGSYSFDPNGEFESLAVGANEIVTFLYEARFSGVQTVDSDPTTTTITVTGVNDTPVAVDDFYSILPGVPRVVTFGEGLLSNDTDVDSTDTLGSAVVVSPIPGGEGQLTAFNADGSFTYDPEAFVGTTQFTYEMDDSQGATSNVATVTLSQGPTLIMTVTTSTVDEDLSVFVIDIELVNPSTTPSTANVNTVAGTASSSDFGSPSASSITLSQTAGTTTQITIPIINDVATPVREGDEWFYVTLSNPGGGAVIAGGPGSIVTTTLTIVDPADAPTFSIEDITVTEPSSSANADVVVRLTGRTLLGAEVWLSTNDGTAAQPGDYTTVSVLVEFGPNSTLNSSTTVVSVPIIDDIIDEHDEIFTADLSAATEPAGSPGQITNLTITDNSADVTIQDADLAPVLQIQDPAPIVEGGTRTVTVTLVGASSDGVTVDAAPAGGTATAGSDYTSTTFPLVWAADETGDKTFDLVTLDDGAEEDAESVILKLFNASSTGAEGVILLDTTGVAIGDLLFLNPTLNSALRSDGVQADGTAVLQINDDEPAVKVVTIVSDGEGMPGDPYFLVFTGLPTPDPGVVAIGSVPELLQRAFGLDEVRSKAATHVAMGMVTTSDPVGPMEFNFTISTPVSTSLNVVQQRTNRSFYLFPGPNFTGLGLVPDDTSIANQLTQTVPNANQALIDAIKAGNPDNTELDRDVVKLDDVVETVWAFNADAVSPAFEMFATSDPLTGSGAASGSLTDLAPFQGMIIMTRKDATGSSGPVPVFDEATASPTLHPVPVRLDIHGPFLSPTATAPVSTALSKGFNLIAPHIWAETPFDTVFAGSGGDISEIYGSAVARWRALKTYDPTSVSIEDRWLTESASIPPFIGPGTIFPELSYWIKVATTVAQDPVLTATGPNIGGGP